MYYPATFTPYEDGSGKYGVTFVDLPGCVSSGDNLDEALRMAEEALSTHVGGMLSDEDPVPRPSSLEEARAAEAKILETEGLQLAPGTLHQFIHFEPAMNENEEAPVRLSISLKPVVLKKIDLMAEELGLTRSGLLAVAASHYCKEMRSASCNSWSNF